VGVVAECGGSVESGMCVILVFPCLSSFNGFGLDFEPSCLILADVEMDVEAEADNEDEDEDVHMFTDFYMCMTDRMAFHRCSVLALPDGVGETGSIA
jgi:hypothetical protein